MRERRWRENSHWGPQRATKIPAGLFRRKRASGDSPRRSGPKRDRDKNLYRKYSSTMFFARQIQFWSSAVQIWFKARLFVLFVWLIFIFFILFVSFNLIFFSLSSSDSKINLNFLLCTIWMLRCWPQICNRMHSQCDPPFWRQKITNLRVASKLATIRDD